MFTETFSAWIHRLWMKSFASIGAILFLLLPIPLAHASPANAQPLAPNLLKALALKKIDQCLRKTVIYLDSAEARREHLCEISGCSVYLRLCSSPAEQMVTEKTLELVERRAPQIKLDCRTSIDAILMQQPTIPAEESLPFEAELEATTLALAHRYEFVHRMAYSSECKP